MLQDIQVLFVDCSKRYGGASARALALAGHLHPWKTAIAALEGSPVAKLARERDIPVKIVGKYRTDPFNALRLAKVIREGPFQVMDTQNIQSKLWGSLAAMLTDVAFIATLNSSYADEQGSTLKGKIYTLLDRWTNFRTDRYIAVSRQIHDDLLRSGIPGHMVDLVTNAVQVDDSMIKGDPALIRQELGIPQDAILYASVGRLVWAKGYEDFIRAFALLVKQVPDAHAVILGAGPLYASLAEQIRNAGLDGRIHLLGHCEVGRVWNVLKASDIFVMSSRSEGVPLALLEAAALGLPILSTRCGGIPEILTDGEDAILVPVGDHSALAADLVRLCEDRRLADRLGARAKAKIQSQYSLPVQVAAIRQAYIKALNHRKGGRLP